MIAFARAISSAIAMVRVARPLLEGFVVGRCVASSSLLRVLALECNFVARC